MFSEHCWKNPTPLVVQEIINVSKATSLFATI